FTPARWRNSSSSQCSTLPRTTSTLLRRNKPATGRAIPPASLRAGHSRSSGWATSGAKWRGSPKPSTCALSAHAAPRPARSSRWIESVNQLYAPTDLRPLLENTDYLVLATPHTHETEGLISAEALALLPPRAVLINIARGAVVDQAALISALQSGRLRGAALDV